MKLKEAIEFGQDCGLESPEECVNNILVHSTMIFLYDHIREEENELKKEAKAAGIQFHKCGMAMKDGKCYMCENFSKAAWNLGKNEENP